MLRTVRLVVIATGVRMRQVSLGREMEGTLDDLRGAGHHAQRHDKGQDPEVHLAHDMQYRAGTGAQQGATEELAIGLAPLGDHDPTDRGPGFSSLLEGEQSLLDTSLALDPKAPHVLDLDERELPCVEDSDKVDGSGTVELTDSLTIIAVIIVFRHRPAITEVEAQPALVERSAQVSAFRSAFELS